MKTAITCFLILISISLLAQHSFFEEIELETNDFPSDLLVSNSGSIYCAVNPFNTSNLAIAIVYKFSERGVLLDSINMDTICEDITIIHTFQEYVDGKIYAIGTSGESSAHESVWVAQLDTNLTLLNHRTFDLGLGDVWYLNSTVNINNDVVIFGSQSINNNGNFFFLVLTSNLDTLFSRKIEPPGFDAAFGILGRSDGSYDICATWTSIPEIGTKVLHLTDSFQIIDTLLATQVDLKSSFYRKENGNLLISGQNALTSTTFFAELGVVEIDENDSIIRDFYYGKPDTVYQPGGWTNLDSWFPNEIYLGGTWHFPFGNQSVNNWVLINKLDSSLNLVWQKYIGGANFHALYSVKASPDHGVVLAFQRKNEALNPNVCIAKIDGNGNFLNAGEPEINLHEIKLFPNPGQNFLMIESDVYGKDTYVSIVDLYGRQLFKIPFTDFCLKIDISSLHAGMYVIQITSGNTPVFKTRWMKADK
ncbi:MAG: T9SS type A sorting domain-containing protein [Bacteroidales bacterium]|nr:T9SS type A sorting domain-containing protein [Bacteroidales bacterium]